MIELNTSEAKKNSPLLDDSLDMDHFEGKCHEEEDEPPPLETIEDLQAREMMRQKLKAQMILEEQLVGEDKALLQHLTEAVQVCI